MLPEFQATRKVRISGNGQQIVRVDYENDLSDYDDRPLLSLVEVMVREVDLMVFSDYAKGALINVQKIVKFARYF